MGRPALDLTGRKFCRLTPIKLSQEKSDGHHAFWECQCDCGNTIIVRKDSLLSGHTKSCGCLQNERFMDDYEETQGMKNTKLYKCWSGIKQRCLNPNDSNYQNYGGRGITICDEWRNNFTAFYKWAISHGYADDLSIDRIDVNGNYEPSNCRWADKETQDYNKRETQKVLIDGKWKTLLEISREYGIPLTTVRNRYRKYIKNEFTLEEFLTKGKLVNLPNNSIYITVDGVTHTASEWERETGVCRKTILNRYRKGIRKKEELFKKGY